MKKGRYLSGLAGILLAGFLLCSGMTVLAAPSVEGDTELKVKADEMVAAEYTVTNDEDMESVTLTLSYDRDHLTYMSGSGGDNFSGNGGNGSVQLSSMPGSREVSFSVRFQGKADGDTTIAVTACTIVVDGTRIDALSGEPLTSEEAEEESGDGEEEDEARASFVIDDRTFYVRRPDDIEGFDAVHLDIQGFDCRVLKHNTLDLYVVRLRSDNGSYRDDFVYNPDTGNVIPFVRMESGTDTVIFIEPEENVHVPTRYTPVNLGWGPKYVIPALKHVIIDGVDEIQDDTNRYLIYGINQDGEKAWYSFDYDKNSLQLFDDVAYQGEQNYILELEEKEIGLRADASEQAERYDRNMARRLYTILFLIILVVLLLNLLVLMYFRMRKMQMPESEEEDSPEEEPAPNSYVTGNLEENESDFQEPAYREDEDDMDLEIIDLDDSDEDN